MEHATSENWTTINITSTTLPSDFTRLPAAQQGAWLQDVAASGAGRGGTYYYYDQSGRYASSTGRSGTMHYTGRTDISEVLSGTVPQAMYGPVFEDEGEAEALGVSVSDEEERADCAVYFTVPIKNENGHIQGALSLRRDAHQYSDVLSGLNLGEGGYTCLIDGTGTILAVSRSEYYDLVAEELNLIALTGDYGDAARAAVAGESGSVKSSDLLLGGATVLYAPLHEGEPAEESDAILTTTDATKENGIEGWALLCYLPTSDLEGYLQSEARNDLLGTLTARVAIGMLVLLSIFYVAWDSYRYNRGEKLRASREHKEILDQTLRAMTIAAESRDVPNKGHGYRVAVYAREIGKHLNLDQREKRILYFEAALHDIGKLAVPEEILNHEAEGTLTAEESRWLMEHVTLGGRILEGLTALPGISNGAMYHHQYYNGDGYCSLDVVPKKGEDIPLVVRIITVADSYDVQDCRGNTNIDLMLEQGSGVKYDPMIAAIMVQLIRDGTIERLKRETNEILNSNSAALAEV